MPSISEDWSKERSNSGDNVNQSKSEKLFSSTY